MSDRLTRVDVIPVDFNVVITVRAGLFVVEAYGVRNFMYGNPDCDARSVSGNGRLKVDNLTTSNSSDVAVAAANIN